MTVTNEQTELTSEKVEFTSEKVELGNKNHVPGNDSNSGNDSNLESLKFKLVDCGDYNFKVNFKESDIQESPKVEYGYNHSLNDYRNKIDVIDNEIWKKIRWYINEYDFIVKYPIINRAFYKYWEMINEFDIFGEYNINSDIILHCAEAPGGFIQGTNIYLQIEKSHHLLNNESTKDKVEIDDEGFTKYIPKKKLSKKNNYKIYTISLNKDIPKYKMFNLPSYNKIVLNKHVQPLYGKDSTGDINNLQNIDYIENVTFNNHFYLVTGDGGFDEGCDFNNKEQLHYQLILNEIYAAIKLQKKNGHFILKMFDIFTDTSLHLLYLLNICYKSVHIYKPVTSRPTNSEKYIICKGFQLNSEDKELFLSQLRSISETFVSKQNNTKTCYSFTLFEKIPDEFIENIKNINLELLNRQCVFLQKAIHLCNDQDFLQKYDIEYTKSSEYRKNTFKKWITHYNLNSYV